MIRSLERLLLGLLATPLALATGSAHAEGDISPHNLFFISPSKNCNEVHYDAVIDDCRFADPPVRAYWREFEDGPDVQSEILFYEQLAYGYEVERISDTRIKVRLKQLPDRTIEATLHSSERGCELETRVGVEDGRIADREAGPSTRARWARLHHVYVYITERGLNPIPRVDYIDIHGIAGDADAIVERVVGSGPGRRMGPPDAMTRKADEPVDLFATPQQRECLRLHAAGSPSA